MREDEYIADEALVRSAENKIPPDDRTEEGDSPPSLEHGGLPAGPDQSQLSISKPKLVPTRVPGAWLALVTLMQQRALSRVRGERLHVWLLRLLVYSVIDVVLGPHWRSPFVDALIEFVIEILFRRVRRWRNMRR